MKRNFVECVKCNKKISKSNIDRHLKTCGVTYESLAEKRYNCNFCGNIFYSPGVRANHERCCKYNPNRVNGKNGSHYGYTHSDDTRKKIGLKSKEQICSDEKRKTMSEHARRRGLGGVRQSKRIKYKNKMLGSTYELIVATSLDAHNIEWDTCNKFMYIDPTGKTRSYTPDIYLPKYDIYLDPKNDFLINNINPKLGFKDAQKINLVMAQNHIKVLILDKDHLAWDSIKKLIL